MKKLAPLDHTGHVKLAYAVGDKPGWRRTKRNLIALQNDRPKPRITA
jgi:hypothetical protein